MSAFATIPLCSGTTSHRPTLVLVPGTLCDGRLFASIGRRLQPWARVIVPSLHELPRASQLGVWVRRLLNRLPARFVLAGFSLGGLLALELLRRAPQRVEGLVMIASNAEGGSKTGAVRSRQLWRDWRMRGAAATARALKPRYFHHQRERRRHSALIRDMAVATPTRAARAQFEWAAKRPSSLSLLADSERPVLVISGAHDQLCPPGVQRRMVQACRGAHWVELPRCGHLVPLEAASSLRRELQHWLLRSSLAQSGASL